MFWRLRILGQWDTAVERPQIHNLHIMPAQYNTNSIAKMTQQTELDQNP